MPSGRRWRPGPAHVQTLIELLLMGARDGPVPVTTVELARRIGRSQQAASKHLEALEEEGLVERYR
ncbi:MAG: helix-turn-helix domain-containing protein, partial [Conexivisphaera sp.]